MHDHTHAPHPPAQDDAPLSPVARRAVAIQALLIEKDLVTADDIRRHVERMDTRTPALGAKVVARAWTDPDFKARLLSDAKAAVAELDIDIGANLIAVENTDTLHNVLVCTLCSCYPSALLGLPPSWYKSLPYRSRVVVEPREVLEEFGLELPQNVEVRVYDSTANVRYIVIPQRPPGTEQMEESELETLITRDSMIGVTKARTPEDP